MSDKCLRCDGFDRMKASTVNQVIAFVEWMADQPCKGGNGPDSQPCRVRNPDAPEWCCPPCRASLLRYGC